LGILVVFVEEMWLKRVRELWIAQCISTVRFSVLINGSPFGFFCSSRGLRQRNHLSPLLFVVVNEDLSRMMSTTMNRGLLSGFSVGSRNNDDHLVSHLLCANDTLIFCETNHDHLFHLLYLFVCFVAISGLKINVSKSELVPIGDVDDVGGLTCTLGCRVASLLMKYLGLPLGASYKAKSWDGIVEKLECHLAGKKMLYGVFGY